MNTANKRDEPLGAASPDLDAVLADLRSRPTHPRLFLIERWLELTGDPKAAVLGTDDIKFIVDVVDPSVSEHAEREFLSATSGARDVRDGAFGAAEAVLDEAIDAEERAQGAAQDAYDSEVSGAKKDLRDTHLAAIFRSGWWANLVKVAPPGEAR